jgi:Flp pilus assembly protein TadD
MGEVYLSLDRRTDAEFEFREALRIDPNLDAAVKNLTILGK